MTLLMTSRVHTVSSVILKSQLIFCVIFCVYNIARMIPKPATSLPSDSTCTLKAEPGKLDIKRRGPGILFISLPIVSLFKPAIMT